MGLFLFLPASRAKLTMLNTVSKIRGQVKNPGYPQSEGLLGETMIRYGKELGDESNFGECVSRGVVESYSYIVSQNVWYVES